MMAGKKFVILPDQPSLPDQPRAIAVTGSATAPLATKPAPKYKAGMYAELQKFGSIEREKQISLWPDTTEGDEPVTVSGNWKLTVGEDKALCAIQKILAKTDYKGNRPGHEIVSNTWKWNGTLPVLAISYSEYFEAYGLERKGDGSYYGRQAEDAIEDLRTLASRPQFTFYERKHWKNGKQLSDLIRAKAPPITLTELASWQDLEKEEVIEVKAGQEVPEKARARGLLIEPSVLLVDSIENFYLLKPANLHKDIQQLSGNKRVSGTSSLFISWLLTKDSPTVRIAKSKLIVILWLSGYIKDRHKDRAEVRLQEAFKAAKELGYLLDFQESHGLYTFSLNPEQCSRVKKAPPATEPEP